MIRTPRPTLLLTLLLLPLLTVSSAFAMDDDRLQLKSSAALVVDQSTGAVLYEKNAYDALPIASITKLMTAMVTLDSRPNLERRLIITDADVDTLRNSHSRLPVGTWLSLEEMLRLALMASENRAASALARSFPGGTPAFVRAMNLKARSLGLRSTHFRDPTGLNSANVSSANDLAKMVMAAADYPIISAMTTTATYDQLVGEQWVTFNNTNALVKSEDWRIDVSKTGFINESGKCLVMQAWLNKRPTVIVLLDALGRYTPMGDSNRIKKWLDNGQYAGGVYSALSPM